MKKKRAANIELLRIIAMLFVVSLHYLGKGGALLAYGDENFTVNTWMAWLIEAFAYVAVNVYVLISGYFLVGADFKILRIMRVWIQVLFYSVGIWTIFSIFGAVPAEYDGLYYASMIFLPVTSRHYWFASMYIFLCLLAPFLRIAVCNMSKKQLRTCVIVLLIFFSSAWGTLLPTSAPLADGGYGIVWFVTLYVIAAYIRLYVPENGNWKKWLLIYGASSVCMFISMPCLGWLSRVTDRLPHYQSIFYQYNAPFTIIGAVSLFLAFRNIYIASEKICRVINRLAGLTFGVYLLHEHLFLRDLWAAFWKVGEAYQTSYFAFHFIGVVLLVYLVGSLVEWLRQIICTAVYKYMHLEYLESRIANIDDYFNAEKGDNRWKRSRTG